MVKNKFCISFKQLCKDICNYMIKIGKKIYTYNFYSYDKSDFFSGAFMIAIFIQFIVVNVIYIVLSVNSLSDAVPSTPDEYIKNLSFPIKYLFLYAFELHVFIELFCPIYYRGIGFNQSIKLTIFYFVYSNLAGKIYSSN